MELSKVPSCEVSAAGLELVIPVQEVIKDVEGQIECMFWSGIEAIASGFCISSDP